MKLKNVGTSNYCTFDGASRIEAAPGDVFEISEARGAMALKDYPGRFEIVGGLAPDSGGHGTGGAAGTVAQEGAASPATIPLAPRETGSLFKKRKDRWKS